MRFFKVFCLLMLGLVLLPVSGARAETYERKEYYRDEFGLYVQVVRGSGKDVWLDCMCHNRNNSPATLGKIQQGIGSGFDLEAVNYHGDLIGGINFGPELQYHRTREAFIIDPKTRQRILVATYNEPEPDRQGDCGYTSFNYHKHGVSNDYGNLLPQAIFCYFYDLRR